MLPSAAHARMTPPTSLIAHPDSETAITLSWDDSNVDVDGFVVERSLHPRRHFEPIAAIGGGSRSFRDSALSASTTYYYRVRGSISREPRRLDRPRRPKLSRRSAIVGATTMAEPVAPSPVDSETPVSTATRTAIPATPVLTPTRTATPIRTATVTATVTPIPTRTATVTATVTLIPTATRTATAVPTATRTATPIRTATVTTTPSPAPTADTIAPAAPSNVTATASSCTQVAISWSAVSDTNGSGLKEYDLYRNGVFVKPIAAPATSTSDSGLAGGTVYNYVVKAVDNAGNVSTPSNTATANTPSCNQPPVANAGPNVSAVMGVATLLNGAASADSDGTIMSYAWTFGDGMTGAGPTPTHTYTNSGSFTATLTVTDDDGARASDTAVVTVIGGAAGAHERSQRFGGRLGDSGYALALDTQGGTLVTGEFSDAVTFGGATLTSVGGTDIFIAKYAANGTHVWSKRLGGLSYDRGQGIAADANGDVFVTGVVDGTVDFGLGPVAGSSRDAFLAKYAAATGALVWAKRLGNTGDDYGNAVTVDADGNVLFTGSFVSTVDFGGGALTSNYISTDVFLAKYSTNGTHVWSKRFGGGATDIAQAIAVDADGNVAITGSFMGVGDFGMGVVRSNGGSEDVFVAKYSAAGEPLFVRTYGDIWGDGGYGIGFDASGNTYVTGSFRLTADFGGAPLTANANGPSDIFLVKLSQSGNHVWSKRMGGSDFDVGRALAVDAAGNVAITGYFQVSADFGAGTVTSAGSYDGFVAKYSTAGVPLWSHPFGSSGIEFGLGIGMDASGRVATTGAFSGSVDFGGGARTSAGDRDVFVVTYTP